MFQVDSLGMMRIWASLVACLWVLNGCGGDGGGRGSDDSPPTDGGESDSSPPDDGGGPDSSPPDALCEGVTCVQGVCEVENGSPVCVCEAGYSGERCDVCAD